MPIDGVLSSDIMTKLCVYFLKGPAKLPIKNYGIQRTKWLSNNSKSSVDSISK